MDRSLTVLLPVHNVQGTLAATVQEVLEVASELTRQLELVIVDDGSTDATSEVARELTSCYPQVRVVCHGRQLGREAAIRSGLERSRGEVVVLRDEGAGAAPEQIRRLWHAAQQAPGGPSTGLQHAGRRRGFQLVERRGPESAPPRSKPARPNYLGRLRDFAVGE